MSRFKCRKCEAELNQRWCEACQLSGGEPTAEPWADEIQGVREVLAEYEPGWKAGLVEIGFKACELIITDRADFVNMIFLHRGLETDIWTILIHPPENPPVLTRIMGKLNHVTDATIQKLFGEQKK